MSSVVSTTTKSETGHITSENKLALFIKQRPEWVEKADTYAIEKILKGQSTHSFRISSGESDKHFVFSWITNNNSVQHVSFNIANFQMHFKNGDPHSCQTLEQLIQQVFHYCEH